MTLARGRRARRRGVAERTAALVAAWLLAAAASARAGDVIVLADGRTLGAPKAGDPPEPADYAASAIAVLEENLEEVVYRLGDVPTKQTLPRAQVAAIHHDPASVPAALREGTELLSKGRATAARERLVATARDGSAPSWAQAEAAWRIASSYETTEPAAEKALAAFARDRPRSRHVVDARLRRARVLCETGREAEGRAEYEAAATLAGATLRELASARFLAAWVDARNALRAADAAALAAAAKAFADLRAKAPAGDDRDRCDCARAACLAPAGAEGESAVAALAPIVEASKDPFVLAVGHTLLGNAARSKGEAAHERALLEESQERFLRVVVLNRDAEGADEFVAEARFHAGESFLLLLPSDADAATSALAKDRARREWRELLDRSPRSPWAKRAKSALADSE